MQNFGLEYTPKQKDVIKNNPILNYRYCRRISHVGQLKEVHNDFSDELAEFSIQKIKLHKIKLSRVRDWVLFEGTWAEIAIWNVVKGKKKKIAHKIKK